MSTVSESKQGIWGSVERALVMKISGIWPQPLLHTLINVSRTKRAARKIIEYIHELYIG